MSRKLRLDSTPLGGVPRNARRLQKKSRPNSVQSLCQVGAAVVAGGLMFVGSAAADNIVLESFEGGTSIFGNTFNSYQYSQGYTSINIPPDAGFTYYTGDLNQLTTSRNASVSILSGGLSATDIDAGLGIFEFSAWFSTYRQQNDWSSLTLQFKDQNGNDVGSSFVIGGLSFIEGLGSDIGVGGTLERDWGQDLIGGQIPEFAREAQLTLFTQRLAGSAADGYTDVIRLNVSAIPEPSGGLVLVAAGMLGSVLRLRRRD